jgi:hypothetical protein
VRSHVSEAPRQERDNAIIHRPNYYATMRFEFQDVVWIPVGVLEEVLWAANRFLERCALLSPDVLVH